MKISSFMASVAAAAFLVPAVCMSQDGPPPAGGPGGAQRDPMEMVLRMQVWPAVKDSVAEYKTTPSDKLKADIKAKIGEAFDACVKKQKEALAKLESDRSAQIDSLLEKALDGKLEPRAGRGGGPGGPRQPRN